MYIGSGMIHTEDGEIFQAGITSTMGTSPLFVSHQIRFHMIIGVSSALWTGEDESHCGVTSGERQEPQGRQDTRTTARVVVAVAVASGSALSAHTSRCPPQGRGGLGLSFLGLEMP